MEKYYKTTDFNFACFLKMRGVDLREMQFVSEDKKVCAFVFRIEEGSEKITKLQREWANSQTAKICKQYAYQAKMLRRELKGKLEER